MPHCGMTLANVRNSFFARERGAIAGNYTVGSRAVKRQWMVDEYTEFLSGSDGFVAQSRRDVSPQQAGQGEKPGRLGSGAVEIFPGSTTFILPPPDSEGGPDQDTRQPNNRGGRKNQAHITDVFRFMTPCVALV
jgi:hypothetical protein